MLAGAEERRREPARPDTCEELQAFINRAQVFATFGGDLSRENAVRIIRAVTGAPGDEFPVEDRPGRKPRQVCEGLLE
ncbi:hypothetical protein J2S43_001123 [Catenuloplanes nepalensis]|uniref:Uncharacterized protein n=1 Tax=Catenuloplanes nepalensis TaxID=587533 RepID=A0ABT9MME5_9ACTN|nr:hypothetical protein [Catenuloplanes nepalensis]MDP9792611.1 hypothetical protein [Catenuloplanes nepalensis]